MLAAHDHAVQCVINRAGPVDLQALHATTSLTGAVPAAFGPAPATWALSSPVTHLAGVRAKILMGVSPADTVVPQQQANLLVSVVNIANVPVEIVSLSGLPFTIYGTCRV